jgi:hypothetical protein
LETTTGIRDTARVLQIRPTTAIAILKKTTVLQHTNPTLLPPRRSRAVRVSVGRAAARDEMWNFVGAKATAPWLWHASDHHTGRVLAYVVGLWKDAVFRILKTLLASFGHHPVLHRQGECLSAAPSSCTAHSGETNDAED